MVQIIGLIVLTYAVARLLQVPLETSDDKLKVGGHSIRIVMLAGISGLSIVVLGVLGVMLLLSSATR